MEQPRRSGALIDDAYDVLYGRYMAGLQADELPLKNRRRRHVKPTWQQRLANRDKGRWLAV